MAKKPVQVTEEDFKKDPTNVQKIETVIPGFADAEPLITYIKVEYFDDLTEKAATEGIESTPLLVPVEKEREEVVIGKDGEPEKNEDGSDKLQAVKYWDFESRELDLSGPSLKKLATALKPFYEKSRTRVIHVGGPKRSETSSSGGSLHDLNAIREWARAAGHEVADKGRIAQKIITAYYKATGKANPEGQQSF